MPSDGPTVQPPPPPPPPPELCGGGGGGGAAFTLILNESLTEAPKLSVAVTVTANVFPASAAVGVPVILPVVKPMLKLPGRPEAA